MRVFRRVVVLCALCAATASGRAAPAGRGVKPSARPLPLRARVLAEGGYLSPLRGAARGRVSSVLGWRRHPIFGDMRHHAGIDLPRPYGTWVYPAQNGIVDFAGWKRGYGWMVELRHGDGACTIYGHLARIFVVPGQLVNKSMLLGAVGSSGYSTGPHLHFEYRNAAGRAEDPRGRMTL